MAARAEKQLANFDGSKIVDAKIRSRGPNEITPPNCLSKIALHRPCHFLFANWRARKMDRIFLASRSSAPTAEEFPEYSTARNLFARKKQKNYREFPVTLI
jgi:hypothetical protein